MPRRRTSNTAPPLEFYKKLIMSFWKLMSVFWKAEIKIKSVFIYHRWI
jgi:hypothetical protein